MTIQGKRTVQIPADGNWHQLPTSPVAHIETVPFGIIDIDLDGNGKVRFPDMGTAFDVTYTFSLNVGER